MASALWRGDADVSVRSDVGLIQWELSLCTEDRNGKNQCGNRRFLEQSPEQRSTGLCGRAIPALAGWLLCYQGCHSPVCGGATGTRSMGGRAIDRRSSIRRHPDRRVSPEGKILSSGTTGCLLRHGRRRSSRDCSAIQTVKRELQQIQIVSRFHANCTAHS